MREEVKRAGPAAPVQEVSSNMSKSEEEGWGAVGHQLWCSWLSKQYIERFGDETVHTVLRELGRVRSTGPGWEAGRA